ncbi:MAG TPA: hypothetical protein VF214_11270, partial [Edaphobacter sp.]
MKVTIDNLDGAGVRDYTAALSAPMRAGEVPLKIERVLNAPSRCLAMLDVNAVGLPVPSRRGRIIVSSDAGALLFTGYLATEPERVYAGVATAGSVYRIAINAVSDEWLLDKQPMPLVSASLAESGGQTLATLANRVASGLLTTTGVAAGATIGVIEPRQTQSWSANAGAIAGAAYSAYRAVNGALSMQPAGSVTHTLSDGDGVFEPAALKTSQVKELANDVTLSGEMEPAAYITEIFSGDGTTTVFQLSEAPFHPKRTANSSLLLSDSFNAGAFNRSVWQVADPGSHLGFSSQ